MSAKENDNQKQPLVVSAGSADPPKPAQIASPSLASNVMASADMAAEKTVGGAAEIGMGWKPGPEARRIENIVRFLRPSSSHAVSATPFGSHVSATAPQGYDFEAGVPESDPKSNQAESNENEAFQQAASVANAASAGATPATAAAAQTGGDTIKPDVKKAAEMDGNSCLQNSAAGLGLSGLLQTLSGTGKIAVPSASLGNLSSLIEHITSSFGECVAIPFRRDQRRNCCGWRGPTWFVYQSNGRRQPWPAHQPIITSWGLCGVGGRLCTDGGSLDEQP